MNEKINGLWDQALREFSKENQFATIMLPAPLREKFAELIVKECCDMVSKRPYVDDGVSIYLHPSTIIKRHFGVEE